MKSIEFLKIVHLRGPNMWTYRPVLEAWVDIGELEDCPSNTIPGFYERLSSWLPSLVEHRCSYEERGGFLRRVQGGIHDAPNLVRYQMNEFLIAAGRHVKPLTAVALEIAEGIGWVSVDVGQTACQVPHAEECIRKAVTEGKVGGKRKSAKC